MIDWLLGTFVATSVLIILVLLVREPVRRVREVWVFSDLVGQGFGVGECGFHGVDPGHSGGVPSSQ